MNWVDLQNLMFNLFSFCLGTICASFLGNVAYRRSLIENMEGYSECEQCNRRLNPVELIPVIGWIISKGRCKDCYYKIPKYYPIGELILGSIYAYSSYRSIELYGVSMRAIVNFIFLLMVHNMLFYLGIFDIIHREIPPKLVNSITFAGFGMNFAAIAFEEVLITNVGIIDIPRAGQDYLLKVIFMVLLVFLMYIISYKLPKTYIGAGDFRFLIMLLLWIPIELFVSGIWLGMLFGGLVGGIVLVFTKEDWKKIKIPYLPILILGVWGSWILGLSAYAAEYLNVLFGL